MVINQYSQAVLKFFVEEDVEAYKQGISVNPIVSEIASWYEKLRNAMEYRQEEVVLQTTILRILKRKLMLGGNHDVASSLARELAWARYVEEENVTDDVLKKAEEKIRLYLRLKKDLQEKNELKDSEITEWIYHLLSSDLENTFAPSKERTAMVNYIFHALFPNISLQNATEEVKNVQLFISIRRTYTKDNVALLRYNLFKQYFGELTEDSYKRIVEEFAKAHAEIERAMEHPMRHKISAYVKRYIPPFLILEDIFRRYKSGVYSLLENNEAFEAELHNTCEAKYNGIRSKVRRAIIRSVIFILVSKVIFAFLIEGTFEQFVYGHVQWVSLILNIIIPTTIMVLASFFITIPKNDNTLRITQAVKGLLFASEPKLGYATTIKDPNKKTYTFIDIVFTLLWMTTFIISFGGILYALNRLQFNIVSQGIFVFFITIVTFLLYRIYQTAHIYSFGDKPGFKTLLADFFFMPVVRVGRHLTEGVSQINIFLFLFDYIIETPFKGLFSFFDQWFMYLHSKRENID